MFVSRHPDATRLEQLETTVRSLQNELVTVRRELHDRVSRKEVEQFLTDAELRLNEIIAEAGRLRLKKQELLALVENLHELRKRVQFIDPNIRNVFLELNHRIRHAEKLVSQLDGKITEKNRSIFLPSSSE